MNPLVLGATAVMGAAVGVVVVWRRRLADRFSADIRRFHRRELSHHACAGHVTTDDALVWIRYPQGTSVRIVVSGSDGDERSVTAELSGTAETDWTTVVSLKALAVTLRPNAAYTVRIHADNGWDGRCQLRTAAPPTESPSRITLAVVSCNNPFNDRGGTSEDATALLAKLRDAWLSYDVHHAFYLGDQVYTDLPARLSLFDRHYFRTVAPPARDGLLDCTAGEVRSLVHERYRLFWKSPEWQELQRSFASHAMLDDHEVVDNFGTAPEHASAAWSALRQGALQAFHDYQGQRGKLGGFAEDFDQTWSHGVVSAYLLDIRSQRRADDETMQMYSPGQLRRLREFLQLHQYQHIILLGLSVPFIHVPDWMADVGSTALGDDSDAADRWSYFKAHQSRTDLLKLLHGHMRDHPHQRIVVVAGDIHVGCVNRINWGDGVRPLVQLASSAITNKQSWVVEEIAEVAPKLSKVMGETGSMDAEAELLPARPGQHNPYGGLNSGIVEVDVGTTESRVRLSLLGLADGEVVPVFESEWL